MRLPQKILFYLLALLIILCIVMSTPLTETITMTEAKTLFKVTAKNAHASYSRGYANVIVAAKNEKGAKVCSGHTSVKYWSGHYSGDSGLDVTLATEEDFLKYGKGVCFFDNGNLCKGA